MSYTDDWDFMSSIDTDDVDDDTDTDDTERRDADQERFTCVLGKDCLVADPFHTSDECFDAAWAERYFADQDNRTRRFEMTVETIYRCDRCKQPISPGSPSLRLQAMGVTLQARPVSIDDLHVCGACVKPLAEFFPNRDREDFGVVILSDDVIHFRSEQRVHAHQQVTFAARIPVVIDKIIGSYADAARKSSSPFHPTRIVLERASDWVINDIRCGNRSEFAQAGDIPGDLFDGNAVGAECQFSVVPPMSDFTVIATYIGKNPEGAIFEAKVYCQVQGEPKQLGERFEIEATYAATPTQVSMTRKRTP